MLIRLDETDWGLGHCKDDPVRPHLPLAWRAQSGREVYALQDEVTDVIRAVICVAYCDGVPITEQQLDRASRPDAPVAVFYTVWSYDKGAGREIVNKVFDLLKQETPCERFVTLSPLTEMARKFHISNGAKFLAKHLDCQNFEYE